MPRTATKKSSQAERQAANGLAEEDREKKKLCSGIWGLCSTETEKTRTEGREVLFRLVAGSRGGSS